MPSQVFCQRGWAYLRGNCLVRFAPMFWFISTIVKRLWVRFDTNDGSWPMPRGSWSIRYALLLDLPRCRGGRCAAAITFVPHKRERETGVTDRRAAQIAHELN